MRDRAEQAGAVSTEEGLQSDLVARLMLLEATVHAKTAVPTAQVFVSVSTEGCVTSFTPPRQKK